MTPHSGQQPNRSEPAGWRIYWDEQGSPADSFRVEGEIYARRLMAAIEIDASMDVLDYGCGFGFAAALIAPHVKTIRYYDNSPRMVEYCKARLAQLPNTMFCDLGSEDGFENCPPMDLILVNSVLQYVDSLGAALDLLGRLSKLMANGGLMVVSDVIPPSHSLAVEAIGVLFKHPSLFSDRIMNVARRYARARGSATLLRISRNDLEETARRNGMEVAFHEPNITHFPKRITAVCRKN